MADGKRVDAFFENALVQRALGRLTSVYKSGIAAVSVPIAGRKIDIANIVARALDRKAIARKKEKSDDNK